MAEHKTKRYWTYVYINFFYYIFFLALESARIFKHPLYTIILTSYELKGSQFDDGK